MRRLQSSDAEDAATLREPRGCVVSTLSEEGLRPCGCSSAPLSFTVASFTLQRPPQHSPVAVELSMLQEGAMFAFSGAIQLGAPGSAWRAISALWPGGLYSIDMMALVQQCGARQLRQLAMTAVLPTV